MLAVGWILLRDLAQSLAFGRAWEISETCSQFVVISIVLSNT